MKRTVLGGLAAANSALPKVDRTGGPITMIRVLAPHANTPVPLMGRVLCVLQPLRLHPHWERLIAGCEMVDCEYHNLGRLQRILLLKSRVQYERANPRSWSYMLNLAQDFLSRNAPSADVDLLADPRVPAAIVEPFQGWLRRVWQADSPGILSGGTKLIQDLKAVGYDTLIFLYPDAVGMGWRRTETVLTRLNVHNILVVNGRRRIMLWDAPLRGKLRWRRFLEHSLLLELAVLPVIIVTSISMAIRDELAGILARTSRRDS